MNIKLNKAKFEYKAKQIKFMGHTLTDQGLQADPDKIRAIVDMPSPTDVPGVQRLMGMVKYLAKFLPKLSDVSEPIRRLTHNDVEWNWSQSCEDALSEIKTLLTTNPVLEYFDPKLEVHGQGDASEFGLGFVMLQNDKPITYSSRALTSAETRYAQIEKELLAQVFGLERNHYYLYGRKTILWTDHKPLVAISQKPLSTAPKRLQRLLLRLHQYDVEIRYKPGREMFLADTLSRAFLPDSSRSAIEDEIESIHFADNELALPTEHVAEIKAATAHDPSLQAVKQYIERGWPDNKGQVSPDAQPYFHIHHDLSIHNELIFKGDRCVIPAACRQVIRAKLHQAHMGIEATLRRARECVYWPGLNNDMKDFLSKCDICNSFQAQQSKEPLILHDIPDAPWQKIGVDFLTVDGVDYMCTVDYYSDYFELDKMHTHNASATIKVLKKHFATHGIPIIVQTDRGPPFTSQEMSDFAAAYEFEQSFSSPEFPQSNGKVESTVKIAKRLLKKTKRAQGDFALTLMNWRNTPTEGLQSSPAQRLFGRRTRTLLPTKHSLLKPKPASQVMQKKERKQQKQKHYHDKGSKELKQLKPGETVRMKPRERGKPWKQARVLKQVGIRSYKVETQNGKEYIRNRKHLRTSKEHFTRVQDEPEPELSQNTPATRGAKQTSSKTRDSITRQTETRKPVTRHSDQSQKTKVIQPATRHSTRQHRPPAYLKDYVQN